MPSKSTINAVGALATGAIIFAGGFMVAKPQFDAAGTFNEKTDKTESSLALEQQRLLRLKSEEKNLPELQKAVTALKLDIPDDEDIAGIARTVVESLPSDVVLESFMHRPMELVEPLEAPAVALESPETPIDTGAPSIPATSDEPEATGPRQLQQVPLVITVNASDTASITEYIDKLGEGPRPILVVLVQETESSSEDEKSKTTTIYGYAFANAPTPEAPTPAPAPATTE